MKCQIKGVEMCEVKLLLCKVEEAPLVEDETIDILTKHLTQFQ